MDLSLFSISSNFISFTSNIFSQGISGYLSQKIGDIKAKSMILTCFDYLKANPNKIEECLFDFIVIYYSRIFGLVAEKIENSVYHYVVAKASDVNVSDVILLQYDNDFKNTAKEMSECVILFLNTMLHYDVISNEKYEIFKKKYSLSSFTEYLTLESPSSDDLRGKNVIYILTQYEESSACIKKKYTKSCMYLSKHFAEASAKLLAYIIVGKTSL